ncbi:MAG: transcription termination/antitermination NusG family protein, partial [Nocardioidaceae bacterium]
MSQPYDDQVEGTPEGEAAVEPAQAPAAPDAGAPTAPAEEAVPDQDAPADEAAAEDVPSDVLGEVPSAAADGYLTGDADEQPDAADEPVGSESAEAGVDTPGDPLEEFREALRAKVGDWFVVHTYSGMENRVKANLENRITSLNMEDYVHEVIVPTEEVAEIKNGQRKLVKRTVLPGYVLVRMDLTDESWAAVRHTPSVTGFVGHSH